MKTLTGKTLLADIEGKFEHLSLLVGNTPMLELTYSYKGNKSKIYVKCEHYNLTGSIKDRMALYTLKKAYAQARINVGDRIVEATSGNTGIAFAAIGKALGHPVTIIMPDWLSRERMDIIKSLGAQIILVSKEEGGFIGSIKLAELMATNHPNIFLPQQFENTANPEAHELTTGKEIWEQLRLKNITPQAFVAGVGTGGTIMGVGNFLKQQNPDIKVHPLEPAESPTLTTGYKVGSHRIQGISDEFIPDIVKLGELDEVVQVNDGDAILMAQKLAEKLGLAVGISSGANVIGAIKQQQKMGIENCVVTIFSDSNKKYLSTDLMKVEPVKEGYLTPEIDFIDYKAFSRL
ncbi:PLP-dependent cysteine synthase family protein [Pedobacter sp. MR22-3]|uniref:PLP-dependent cysteine synthase family protein n=1 Tax=Pedobacter sp. MR22-3 TaxID=2994552 RepID=UPI00224816AE|nr:PLP-dependent cysteine synthase family protein [Pedobacter sp. MR22-3]MCX2584732.1 PLP-dependent cysteine synthase family protein [Pedobacter sp. MR22-3]